jgi:hypothetical protein
MFKRAAFKIEFIFVETVFLEWTNKKLYCTKNLNYCIFILFWIKECGEVGIAKRYSVFNIAGCYSNI